MFYQINVVFQTVDLDGPLLSKIQNVLKAIYIIKLIRWLLLISGLVFIGLGCYIFLQNRKIFTIAHVNELSKKSSSTKEDSNKLSSPKLSVHERGHDNPVMSGHEFDRY